MTASARMDSGILHQFPLPLKSLGIEISARPEELAKATKEALETEATWGISETSKERMSEFSIARLGDLMITSGRTTPVALQYKQGRRLTLEMCYAGHSRFREGISDLRTVTNEILVFPNSGGTLCGGFHSGISFHLGKERLETVARAILGASTALRFDTPRVIGAPNRQKTRGKQSSLLFSLFRHIDEVLNEDKHLHPHLALDDQIYRTFILNYAKEVKPDELTAISKGKRLWSTTMDDLVEFIRLNSHRSLSMTNLELESSYSARHLQILFQEKFNCSPMQFVRRQRLASAMEKLQSASWDDSVTSIARNCGYRYTSNFSSDFHREFGVAPSVVLRASRKGKKGGGDSPSRGGRPSRVLLNAAAAPVTGKTALSSRREPALCIPLSFPVLISKPPALISKPSEPVLQEHEKPLIRQQHLQDGKPKQTGNRQQRRQTRKTHQRAPIGGFLKQFKKAGRSDTHDRRFRPMPSGPFSSPPVQALPGSPCSISPAIQGVHCPQPGEWLHHPEQRRRAQPAVPAHPGLRPPRNWCGSRWLRSVQY